MNDKNLTKFVCIKRCKLQGHRNFCEVGEVFYSNTKQWRLSTFIDIHLLQNDRYTYGIGKSYDFVPFYKFRELQINSIFE